MNERCLAILELLERPSSLVRRELRAALLRLPGAGTVAFEEDEPILTFAFDPGTVGLAEIVREVEDVGVRVVAVARRAVAPAIEVMSTSLRRPEARPAAFGEPAGEPG